MNNLYTVKEVSEMLKLVEGTVRNKISKGEIKAVKVLGATRIEEEEIKRLIKPFEVKGEEE